MNSFNPEHARAIGSCETSERLCPVDVALAAVLAEVGAPVAAERVSLAAARGRIAFDDIAAPMPVPPHDNAAVDGYGIVEHDLEDRGRSPLTVVARRPAGCSNPQPIGRGETIRFCTGSLVPPEIAAVVADEQCGLDEGRVMLRGLVPPGRNIRRRGEDVATGTRFVEAGTSLDWRHIAVLAATGFADVAVRRRIRVALVSTGDELSSCGTARREGAIYDSNLPMLAALAADPWIEVIEAGRVPDDVERLGAWFGTLADTADVIVSSGGASRSEADHCAAAIGLAGGRATALRVAMKPGKPLVCGRIGQTAVLGLAGNPVAAAVGFMVFGRPLLRACAGYGGSTQRGIAAVAAAPLRHSPGTREYVAARIEGANAGGQVLVRATSPGGSARLSRLLNADGLIEIAEDKDDVSAGDSVIFHPFGGVSERQCVRANRSAGQAL